MSSATAFILVLIASPSTCKTTIAIATKIATATAYSANSAPHSSLQKLFTEVMSDSLCLNTQCVGILSSLEREGLARCVFDLCCRSAVLIVDCVAQSGVYDERDCYQQSYRDCVLSQLSSALV